MIYLDNGATTLLKPRSVYQASLYALKHYASPGRGGHKAAMDAAEAVFDCRVLAAQLFDTQPDRVVFTMNATHGLNVAIKSLVGPGDRVVVSGFEHNAAMRPLVAVGADVVIAGRTLFDHAKALMEFEAAITPETKAVICTHVSNVFGYVLPVERIAQLCRERKVPFILDASQSAGCLDVSMEKLGAAFIAMPGHKGLYGPQGTGILLCNDLGKTLLEGGTGSQSQLLTMPEFLPDRHEAGTHNVTGICGLKKGIEFVLEKTPAAILKHEQKLITLAGEKLAQTEGVHCFIGPVCVQAGVVSFTVDGHDCEEVGQYLADHGIAVRAGLHCAPVAHESAETIQTGTIRVSVGAFNRKRDISALARCLQQFQ